MPRASLLVTTVHIFALSLFLTVLAFTQDAATGAIHGTVFDPAGAHIAQPITRENALEQAGHSPTQSVAENAQSPTGSGLSLNAHGISL